MGIERQESVRVTYTCDRCRAMVRAFNELSTPHDAPEDWVDVKLSGLRGFSTPVRRVLCGECKTELTVWFKDQGGAF